MSADTVLRSEHSETSTMGSEFDYETYNKLIKVYLDQRKREKGFCKLHGTKVIHGVIVFILTAVVIALAIIYKKNHLYVVMGVGITFISIYIIILFAYFAYVPGDKFYIWNSQNDVEEAEEPPNSTEVGNQRITPDRAVRFKMTENPATQRMVANKNESYGTFNGGASSFACEAIPHSLRNNRYVAAVHRSQSDTMLIRSGEWPEWRRIMQVRRSSSSSSDTEL